MYDVFICHASDDKAQYVEPLIGALQERGLRVWYDRTAIGPCDELAARVEDGLRSSRFAVVVLTPRLFEHRPEVGAVVPRYWPRLELGALINLESVEQRDRIIAVRCELTHAEMTARAPILASRLVLAWEHGLGRVVDQIAAVVGVASMDAPASSQRHVALPAPASPVYNLLPRRAQALVGRERDLDRLDELLRPGRTERRAVRITGLAGIGKTELTLHLVDRLARAGRFPGGIYWFDASQPDLTPIWGGRLAVELAIDGPTVAARAASVMRHVGGRRPVLLVLDNVESWTRETMPGPLPDGPEVALLVTTRHARLGGRAFEAHVVEGLAPADARALLRAAAGRPLDDIDELIEHLGGHALALELAGAYLGEYVTETARSYLARLRAGDPVEDAVRTQVAYERTVEQAFDTIWHALSASAQQAARITASFDDVDASIDFLSKCGVDGEVLRVLGRFHLITIEGGRWRMHRLVRAHARRRGSDEQRAAAYTSLVEGVLTVAREVPDLDGYRLYASDRLHFEKAIELAPAVWDVTDERRSELLCRVSSAAMSGGDYLRARDLSMCAMTDAAHLGAAHPRLEECRNNLAACYKELGELPRARDLLEQALVMLSATPGADPLAVARSQSNLSAVFYELGELERARELQEQALATYQALGGQAPQVARCQNNLGLVLESLGDLPRARALLELAHEAYRNELDEHHPALAVLRSNLGQVLRGLGELPRARALLEQSLASQLVTLGEAHPQVSNTRNNLALVLGDLGDNDGACALLEQMLAFDLKNLGDQHPRVALCRSNLGWVLNRLGDLEGARATHEQALAGFVASLGENHPHVATCRSSLALVLEAQGDLEGARRLLEQAVEWSEVHCGPLHLSTITTLGNLALVLGKLGDVTTARALCARVLASIPAELGANHPLMINARRNLAAMELSLGSHAEGCALLELALASARATFGEHHETTINCHDSLAEAFLSAEEPARAARHLELALASAIVVGGAEHPGVARCRNKLALVLRELGEHERARELLEQVLATAQASLRADDPQMAVVQFNLATVCEAQGDHRRARDLYGQCLATEEHALGPGHPSVACTRAHLARAAACDGDLEVAFGELMRALESVEGVPEDDGDRIAVEAIATYLLDPEELD